MSTDHREAAQAHIKTLIRLVTDQLSGDVRDRLVSECESLAVSIRAFHMEGIRFRMFNVDRLLTTVQVTAEARGAFAEARRELEAAGFHTRSHQAPSS